MPGLEAPCAGSVAWESLPSAYRQLSRTYEADATAADQTAAIATAVSCVPNWPLIE